MKLRQMGLAVAVLTAGVVCCGVDLANAEIGCGYGFGPGLYRFRHLNREIPYFAEYPPVYYSHVVPRTYGYSPYAYGPDVRTPDVVEGPKTVANPYVPAGEIKPIDRQTKSNRVEAPTVVINPYVEEPQVVADAR